MNEDVQRWMAASVERACSDGPRGNPVHLVVEMGGFSFPEFRGSTGECLHSLASVVEDLAALEQPAPAVGMAILAAGRWAIAIQDHLDRLPSTALVHGHLKPPIQRILHATRRVPQPANLAPGQHLTYKRTTMERDATKRELAMLRARLSSTTGDERGELRDRIDHLQDQL